MSATLADEAFAEPLPAIKGFMFDLDGTLLLSDRTLGGYQVLPGAIDVLSALEKRGVPFVVLTNGSAYPPPEQAARLRALGLPVPDDRLFTPSSVATVVMARRHIERVLVLGSRGVGHALAQAGIDTLFPGEPGAHEVGAVYVGWHPDCNMRDIEAACHAIWAGAALYVASDVPFFATTQGRTMGYSYAIVGAIRRMTRCPFVLTGKPSLNALRFVAKRLGIPVHNVGIVGDDPAVEIVMGRRGGAATFGVTTGVMSRADWMSETGNRRPHRVLDAVQDLLAVATVPV